MNLSTLNEIAERSNFLPTKKVTELNKDNRYRVTALKEVKIRFGIKVVAELDESFQIFLPERISSAILKDEEFFLIKLGNKVNKLQLTLTYLGGSRFRFE